jgi:hypothetical protein
MLNDKFWSILAMPIGVTLCFGPCILAWILSGPQKPAEEDAPVTGSATAVKK